MPWAPCAPITRGANRYGATGFFVTKAGGNDREERQSPGVGEVLRIDPFGHRGRGRD